VLIHRVQLPEDAALDEAVTTATPAPNPPTVASTLDTRTTNDTSASQTPEATAPEAQLPTAGGNVGTTSPTGSRFLPLIDYMWNDPHSRTCEFRPPSPTDDRLGANQRDRAHSIVLPDCGQPTRGVVLSTTFSSGGCVFDVLVAPDRALGLEGTDCGLDNRVPCWDDDLPDVVCLLCVFGH